MPTKTYSPFYKSFKSSIRRGTPFTVAIEKIAKKSNTTFTSVCEALWKDGICKRQKISGQWIYFPCESVKPNAEGAKEACARFWQEFSCWCVTSGYCTPEKLAEYTGSQSNFQNFCKKFFAKQFTSVTDKKAIKFFEANGFPKTTTTTSKTTKTYKTTGKSKKSSYKFPTSSKKRTRRAA